jgi:N-acetylneuraminic acid mutarotase
MLFRRAWPLVPTLFATFVACSDDTESLEGGGGSGAGQSTTSMYDVASTGAAAGGTMTCGPTGGIDPSAPTGAWSTLAPLAGGPRQETAVVELGGRIYVLGGFTLGGIVPTVEVYDPVADAWSAAADLPEPLHHANAAVVGGRIYVLGFLSTGDFVARGEGFAYDPSANAWTPVAPMPNGTQRGASATAAIGDRILVAGGFRGGAVEDASIYDPATDSWEAIAPLPTARDHGVGASVGEVFYSIAGRDAQIGDFRDATYAFDPAVGSWCELEPIPTPRGGVGAAVVDGRIVVVGGEGNAADPDGVFTEVEAFDPAMNRWATLAPLPVGRHGTGAAAVGSILYLPGGADQEAFGAVATVTALSP